MVVMTTAKQYNILNHSAIRMHPGGPSPPSTEPLATTTATTATVTTTSTTTPTTTTPVTTHLAAGSITAIHTHLLGRVA